MSDKQLNDYITVYLHQQADSQRVTSQKNGLSGIGV